MSTRWYAASFISIDNVVALPRRPTEVHLRRRYFFVKPLTSSRRPSLCYRQQVCKWSTHSNEGTDEKNWCDSPHASVTTHLQPYIILRHKGAALGCGGYRTIKEPLTKAAVHGHSRLFASTTPLKNAIIWPYLLTRWHDNSRHCRSYCLIVSYVRYHAWRGGQCIHFRASEWETSQPPEPCEMITRRRQLHLSYEPDTSMTCSRNENAHVGVLSWASGRAIKTIRVSSLVPPPTAVAIVHVSGSPAVSNWKSDYHVSQLSVPPHECSHHKCVAGWNYSLTPTRAYDEADLTAEALAPLRWVYSRSCRWVCLGSARHAWVQPTASTATWTHQCMTFPTKITVYPTGFGGSERNAPQRHARRVEWNAEIFRNGCFITGTIS